MFTHGNEQRIVLDQREHGGYFWTVSKTIGETIYLCCKDKCLKQCKATATIVARNFVTEGVHTHPIDDRVLRKKRFNDALYAAVTSSLQSFRNIYDKICERDPDGAAEVPFVCAQKSVARWRRTICPPMPNTLEHYAEFLGMEQWQRFTNYDSGQLNVTIVRGEDESSSVVYGDIEFLRNIATVHINLDATFAVCPRKPKVLQLLTIMAQIDDANLPIVWALMERKTYHAYVAVLQHFSTMLAPHISPTSYMTDFEPGLSAALQTVYPEAVAQRCYFHYCQAMIKRTKKEGLLGAIKNSEDMQIVFRKLMALALLPADDIAAAFQWITTNTPLDIAIHFASMFRYIDRHWLNHVGSQGFSVFGMECKTNNAIEAYHRVLRIRMGVHPSMWKFTENLRRLQIVIRSSISSLDSGLPITRPSAEHHIVQHKILQRAWDLSKQQRPHASSTGGKY